MRYRIFKDDPPGGGLKYISTEYSRLETASEVVADLRARHHIGTGDVVYVDDTYCLLEASGYARLSPEDERVTGLYGQAAKAERERGPA